MRTLILTITLLLLSYSSHAYEIIINGTVTDIETSNYVANQELLINIDTNGIGGYYYNSSIYTNNNGYFYDTISIPDSISGIVYIETYSCGLWVDASDFFSPNIVNLEFNIEICTNPTGNDCEAFFEYYNYDDQLSIQFFDLSFGWPTNWSWDFGDGSTSNEQNPIHQYSSEGIYTTTLIIESDSCLSQYTTEILVFYDSINSCQANFSYYNEPGSMTFDFFDLSFGNIENWSWDFGDGNLSNSQNPSHTYATNGTYFVSLAIITLDSCFDYTTDAVQVGNDSSQCNANYTYVLDTLNNTPNTYIFTDISEGEIGSWYWEFGDGSISYDQNPIHTYSNSETYNVCLTITGMQGITCTSTSCNQVSMIEYYNFGGQAFINNYPINIDSTDIDNIAIAYLYRKIENRWEYMDQNEFWKYGYYWFVDKPVGDYIIRTELKQNSLDYPSFAPTYYNKSNSWKDATIFTLANDQQYAVNIEFTELESKPSGIGTISGFVIADISCGTINNIDTEHVLIQLFNNVGQLVDYTFTDDIGNWEFSGLGTNKYNIAAEYPGRYSEKRNIDLSNNNPNIEDINLIIYCSHILDIDENFNSHQIQTYTPQPNPASNYVNCRINSKVNALIELSITSLSGIEILNNSISISSGSQILTTDISTLKSGIYILKLSSYEHNLHDIHKIIIIN